MTQDPLDSACERVAKALAARRVRERAWACGNLQDDRYCLVAEGKGWKIGYFERGNFDVRYETVDLDDAVTYFVDWVTREDRGTRRDAAATKAWLERNGLQRP
jgi:hypothetical protein